MMMNIIPNEGLNTIKLGASFHGVINAFKHDDISIIYSSSDYLTTPIKVVLKQYHIDLIFIHYKLVMMELTNMTIAGENYAYNGINLSDLTIKNIYNKIFGPTYPGTKVNHHYILRYPGISFKIDNHGKDLSDMLHDTADYRCQGIIISDKEFKFDEPTINNDFKIQSNTKLGIIKLIMGTKEYICKIGVTNQQDILNFLGPPQDYFNKFDSRLLIHNTKNSQIYKFHNYFTLGVDFLYDLNTGTLKKIILHSNLIESDQFGKWNRCNYEIFLSSESPVTSESDSDGEIIEDKAFDPYGIKISNNVYFHQLTKYINDPPILLNRLESENGELKVESLTEFNWGNSMVYCGDRVIWEVVGDCISCITIY